MEVDVDDRSVVKVGSDMRVLELSDTVDVSADNGTDGSEGDGHDEDIRPVRVCLTHRETTRDDDGC